MPTYASKTYLGGKEVLTYINDDIVGLNTFYSASISSSISPRTDAYSGSVKLAMPFNQFTELGMTNFYDSIDAEIRGTGTNYPIVPTGSDATYFFASGSTTDYSASLWSDEGYDTSLSTGVNSPTSGWNAGVITTAAADIGSNDFVIEFWINVQATAFLAPPFHGHIFGGTSGDYLTIQYSSNPQFRFYVNGTNTWSTTPNFNLGFGDTNWKHVTIVKNGTSVYVYVNGNRIGVGTRAATVTNEPSGYFNILGTTSENDTLWRLIQDFRFYSGTNKGITGGATITVPDSIVEKITTIT